MNVLAENEILSRLKDLDGWALENNLIGKDFVLKDFKAALDFVNKVGAEAEAMDHHPDIFIHSWNKVKITVSTHSANGITVKDFQLAGKIESLKL